VRQIRVKTTIGATVVFLLLPISSVNGETGIGKVRNLERAVAWAVQQEVQTGHLENRGDVCVGFASKEGVDTKAVISELRRKNYKIHTSNWCNSGPRGMTINIVGPIKESSPDAYELVIELGDSTGIQGGEHFATLLRRGTYVIECREGAEPKLIEYRQGCCHATKKAADR
jgi:hypothetical protein